MLTTVIKRDGRIVDFNPENIKSAISFAMQRTEKGIDQSIINKIVEYVENKNVDQLSVEEIHNIIEKRLMSSSRKDAAKEYVKERHRRDVARQSKAKVMFDEIVSTKATDITRENANMNADTPAGMMMKFASETTKTFVDNYLLSDDVKELVSNNIMHVHDKDYYPTKSLTCIQHPLDKIFENGFRAGHGEARPPKRIESASILACISMETVQNEMHGGQAIPAFDFYLAPFVRLTLKEELKKLSDATGKDLNQYGDIELKDYIKKDLSDLEGTERYIQSAINQTVSRVHQALESLVHNLNTIHSRGGNQVVFSSINYGTDTSAEGRCIIREILNTTYEGVGNGSTAIFPIQIWKLKKGVSYLPTDPNYDLYKFACKVSARRFFPNFLNLDATYNQDPLWDENDPKRYIHEVATMGCVDGEEVITYKKNDEIITTSFKRMWNDMSSIFPIESQENLGYEEGEYIDLNGIEIFDKDGFVKCYRIIKNPDKGDWYKVTLTNGRSLLCTSDHPWSIINDGKESVIQTKDLSDGDVVCVSDSYCSIDNNCSESEKDIELAWLLGFIMCDGCYDGQLMSTVGMDETDVVEKYCKCFKDLFDYDIIVNERHRGKKGDYIELKAKYGDNPIIKQFKESLVNLFGGVRKIERRIPIGIMNNPNRNVRASFLAGVIDADGYINDNRKRSKIQVGSTNKELALETALLAQSLDIPAKYYDNHYNGSENIRVRVEFDATKEVVCQMSSGKKKSVYINQDYNPIKFDNSVVSKIEFIGNRDSNSFDVTTESEHFIVSGIRSHNCRTRVYGNRFGEYPTSIGRGNLSFTTLNLPKIAIEAALATGSLFENADGKIVSIFDESVDTVSDDLKKDITDKTLEIFFADLSKYLDVVAKQLDERYKFQATAKAKQFPLLMGGLWNGSEKLNPDDTIESVIKEGTLGIGFIGLAEALVALTGKHHGESDESQKLGLKIIGLINDKAKEYSDKYDHNYSCFATPAEGLSGKFTKVDKKEFGIIKGITDKDYYTNSNHVPVWYKCSAKHKAEIEGPYHEITPAGHIFYVEMDGELEKNPEAIMNIVDLMYKYNIGYGSVNHNVARCEDCGHESVKEFEKNENGELCCPICGSTYVTHLQRITGYLVGTIDRWNSGKQAEWRDRVNHKI